MARGTKARKAATASRLETILSSAAVLTARNNRRIAQPDRGWQAEAWDFYDAVGVLAYVVAWLKGALGKATLYPVKYGANGDPVRVDDPQVVGILNTFGGGPQGQSQMLAAFAPHLFVPGEGYGVGRDILDASGQPTGATEWFIAGVDEMQQSGNDWLYDTGDGEPERLNGDEVVVFRVWNPHPRKSWHADSTVRHVLSDLAEIVGYNQRVLAEINSRLASNGLLLLPNEISFGAASPDGEAAPPGVEPITWQFTQVAKIAMSDRRSAAALVPIIGTMPADQIEKVQWLQFWGDFDDALADLRKDALARLAMGLNVPPEVITGVGDVSHWGAWAVDEAAIKMHVEPLLQVLCDGIKVGYFWPALEVDGVEDAQTYGIAFDASRLKARPNKFPEGIELYDRNLLTGEAVVREAGFEVADMGTETDIERIERLDAAHNTRPGAGNEPAVPVPSNTDIPTQGPPDPAESAARAEAQRAAIEDEIALAVRRQSMLTAADGMVLNALQLVGKRLTNAVNGLDKASISHFQRDVPAVSVYMHVPVKSGREKTVFADLWPTAAIIAKRLNVDLVTMQARLSAYLGDLVTSKTAHTLTGMSEALGDMLP